MPSRYTDCNSLTGQQRGQLSRIIVAMFPKSEHLEEFIRQSVGSDLCSSINFDQAPAYACMDLLTYTGSRGMNGQLLEALSTYDPANNDLRDLILYLVSAGYLRDNQTPAKARRSTNPQGIDWIRQCEFDRFKIDTEERHNIVLTLEPCFPDVASVEAFVRDNITNDFGKTLAHQIDRRQSVPQVLDHIVAELGRVGWITVLATAAANAFPEQPLVKLLLAHIQQANRPKPAPAPVAPPRRPTAPAVEKSPRVASLTRKLPPQLVTELTDLIVSCYSPDYAFEELCYSHLGERQENIAGSGGFKKVVRDVVNYAVDEGKEVALLNGVLAMRWQPEKEHGARRTDVRDFVLKLAATNHVVLAN